MKLNKQDGKAFRCDFYDRNEAKEALWIDDETGQVAPMVSRRNIPSAKDPAASASS
jgi:hypothetical protein